MKKIAEEVKSKEKNSKTRYLRVILKRPERPQQEGAGEDEVASQPEGVSAEPGPSGSRLERGGSKRHRRR